MEDRTRRSEGLLHRAPGQARRGHFHQVLNIDIADAASMQWTGGRERCEWCYSLVLTYYLWGSRSIPPSPRHLGAVAPRSVFLQVEIASFDTLSVRENAAQFLFWVSFALWRCPLTDGW